MLDIKTDILSDNIITEAVIKKHNIIGDYTITREQPAEAGKRVYTNITVTSPQKEIKLLEINLQNKEWEFNTHVFLKDYGMEALPHIYYVDKDKKIILHEDLSESYFRGFDYDEENENGNSIRSNYDAYLHAAANYHRIFWENAGAFEQMGFPGHFESERNMLMWIYEAMEKPFIKYRKNEESGKFPRKDTDHIVNNITQKQLDYYEEALKYIKLEYPKLVSSRFKAGKNITVIHGDLHPGQMFMSKTNERTIKFIDLEAVRIGLCTDDLAMLIALHIASDTDEPIYALDNNAFQEYLRMIKKSDIIPMLDSYYNCLNETVKNYPYETFMNDYKLSISENMFFTIRLINSGTFDYRMQDKAIRAFELFVLEI